MTVLIENTSAAKAAASRAIRIIKFPILLSHKYRKTIEFRWLAMRLDRNRTEALLSKWDSRAGKDYGKAKGGFHCRKPCFQPFIFWRGPITSESQKKF